MLEYTTHILLLFPSNPQSEGIDSSDGAALSKEGIV